MPDFNKAVQDTIIDGFTISQGGTQDPNIMMSGRIEGSDDKFVYISIAQGFEVLSGIHKNFGQFFDINFHIDQTSFQLQLQALSFVVDHNLFEKLINNPSYAQEMNDQDDLTHEYQLR